MSREGERFDLRKLAAGVALLPGLAAVGGWMQWKYRHQAKSEEDSPGLVMLNEHSDALATLATGLAREGREDDAAVAEIRRAARGHERDLRVAALSARQDGLHHQAVLANRTHRLLDAAVRNGPVAPVDPADEPLLAGVSRFQALTRKKQWAALVSLQPELAAVADDVRGEPGAILWLHRRLRPLVGPHARTDEPLLRTVAAERSASEYLHRLGPSTTAARREPDVGQD